MVYLKIKWDTLQNAKKQMPLNLLHKQKRKSNKSLASGATQKAASDSPDIP